MVHMDERVIKRVAVIGGGPGGLAAAKYLDAENAFSEIVIFEQRLNVGGVWNATPAIRTDKHFTIPLTRPSTNPSEPIQEHGVGMGQSKLEFLSPIYDNLDTNIPQMLMKYSDHSFPEGTSLFPRHEVVLKYLERYSDEVRHRIRFGTQVLDVRPVTEEGSDEKWSVYSKDLVAGEESVSIFDAVIVANGHYNDPYVPEIPGIADWNATYPGSISHSKFYRRPDDFQNKKVLIIGNSASGTDLAAQILPHCRSPLLISSRSPPTQSLPSATLSTQTTSLPEIARFHAPSHSITFANAHFEKDIDAIIFCTGYLYSFPFLASLYPPLIPPAKSAAPNGVAEGQQGAKTSTAPLGTRVQNLYQHIFYAPLPTLSFLALPQRIVPFPLSESQASVIARHLSGRLSLPLYPEMVAWEAELLEEKRKRYDSGGAEGKFHLMGHPDDTAYINLLYAWAVQGTVPVTGTGTGDTLAGPERGPQKDGDGDRDSITGLDERKGKMPPFWGAKELWMRERTPLIKKAARERMGGGEMKTLEDLGFDFVEWRKMEEGRVGTGKEEEQEAER